MTRQNAPKESLTAGDYLFSKTQYKFVFFLLQIYASWKINVQKKTPLPQSYGNHKFLVRISPISSRIMTFAVFWSRISRISPFLEPDQLPYGSSRMTEVGVCPKVSAQLWRLNLISIYYKTTIVDQIKMIFWPVSVKILWRRWWWGSLWTRAAWNCKFGVVIFFWNQFFQILRVLLWGMRAENLDSDRK